MIRTLLHLLLLSAVAVLPSCHETIHMLPSKEPLTSEEVELLLRLHIDNDAPQLGAIIDYTVSPPIIILSDEVPSKATSTGDDSSTHGALLQRAHNLADAFNEIAPYDLDGDRWEFHLKYEVYAATADQVNRGQAKPVHVGNVTFRADEKGP